MDMSFRGTQLEVDDVASDTGAAAALLEPLGVGVQSLGIELWVPEELELETGSHRSSSAARWHAASLRSSCAATSSVINPTE